MRCERCKELLVEYHLGELDDQSANQVTTHLASGCKSCLREFEDIDKSIDLLVGSISLEDSPESARIALFNRISAATPNTSHLKRAGLFRHIVTYAAIGATAAAIGFILPDFAMLLNLKQVDVAQTSDDSTLNHRSDILGAENSGEPFNATRLVSFRGSETVTPSTAAAFMVWDPVAKEMHIHASGLVKPTEQAPFIVWFETSDGMWLVAGELNTNENGSASSVFPIPIATTAISKVVISIESQPTSSSPTRVQLVSDSLKSSEDVGG